jgi:hypothetical protein
MVLFFALLFCDAFAGVTLLKADYDLAFEKAALGDAAARDRAVSRVEGLRHYIRDWRIAGAALGIMTVWAAARWAGF